MIPEQELTVILSFYHSPMLQSTDKNKSQEDNKDEEIKKNIEEEKIIENNMNDTNYLTPSLKSTSTTVFKFHDFDNDLEKESKEGIPTLPSNPPPLINTEVKSNFKLLRETFEQKSNIKNQEIKKLEDNKMSSAGRLVQEAKISEKRWSSHPERVVEGTPPKPVSFFFSLKKS